MESGSPVLSRAGRPRPGLVGVHDESHLPRRRRGKSSEIFVRTPGRVRSSVVVAGGQRVGPEHDAALDPRRRTRRGGSGCTWTPGRGVGRPPPVRRRRSARGSMSHSAGRFR
jgi:hypothetical protein